MNKNLFFVICLVMLIFFVLTSCLINIYVDLNSFSPIISYIYLVVLLASVYRFIAEPIFSVFYYKTTPYKLFSENSYSCSSSDCIQIIRNMTKSVDDEEGRSALGAIEAQYDIEGKAKVLVKSRLEKCKDLILNKAIIVGVVTAFNKKSSLDALIVLGYNVSMIRDICRNLGFRPSFVGLVKLYIYILSTALLAKTTDEILDSENLLGDIMGNVVSSSINVLLTIRIGYIAMEYIDNPTKFNSTEVRKYSKEKSRELIKEVVPIVNNLLRNGLNSITS